jgi:hypothetical protein
MVRCDPRTAACTFAGISAGQTTASLLHTALIDERAAKLLVLATDEPFTPALYRCNLDGTACTHTTLSSHDAILPPTAVIDAVGQKLLVLLEDDANGQMAVLRCGLDGSACTFADLAGGLGSAIYSDPSAVIDATNNKLLAVPIAQTDGGAGPSLFRCNVDGTACEYVDISIGRPYTTGSMLLPPTPSAVIDAANGKLLVVGCYDSMPGLVRCALDGTGCTYVARSMTSQFANPSAVIDPADARLLTVAVDTASGQLALFSSGL